MLIDVSEEQAGELGDQADALPPAGRCRSAIARRRICCATWPAVMSATPRRCAANRKPRRGSDCDALHAPLADFDERGRFSCTEFEGRSASSRRCSAASGSSRRCCSSMHGTAKLLGFPHVSAMQSAGLVAVLDRRLVRSRRQPAAARRPVHAGSRIPARRRNGRRPIGWSMRRSRPSRSINQRRSGDPVLLHLPADRGSRPGAWSLDKLLAQAAASEAIVTEDAGEPVP